MKFGGSKEARDSGVGEGEKGRKERDLVGNESERRKSVQCVGSMEIWMVGKERVFSFFHSAIFGGIFHFIHTFSFYFFRFCDFFSVALILSDSLLPVVPFFKLSPFQLSL